jgi:P-type E1-E2 ATPase
VTVTTLQLFVTVFPVCRQDRSIVNRSCKLVANLFILNMYTIGDGVNDVAMIQAATIGVGIMEREGSSLIGQMAAVFIEQVPSYSTIYSAFRNLSLV